MGVSQLNRGRGNAATDVTALLPSHHFYAVFFVDFRLFHVMTAIKIPTKKSSNSPATTGMITEYSRGKKYLWIKWSLSMKGRMIIQTV